MSAVEIEQGEDPGIGPRAALTSSARADRENAAGVPVVGPAAVPGPTAVTLTRPLCIDGELSLDETETRAGTIDTTGATA